MNLNSPHADPSGRQQRRVDRRPILVVPYMWIGDFVRCHTVVKLLKARFPSRPVDVLATTLCAPLADYMPEAAPGDRGRPAAQAPRLRRSTRRWRSA